MRRVNVRPRLDEAGVVVVAAGRQDMILSSQALVPGTDILDASSPHGVNVSHFAAQRT